MPHVALLHPGAIDLGLDKKIPSVEAHPPRHFPRSPSEGRGAVSGHRLSHPGYAYRSSCQCGPWVERRALDQRRWCDQVVRAE